MREKKVWKPKEIEFLKNNFSKIRHNEIAQKLDRSIIGIRSRAWRLGLHSKIIPKSKHEYQLKQCFGLTGEEYNQKYKKQKGLCAICGLPEKGKSGKYRKQRKLSVDHNHYTNKIRGLLCGKCNSAIGLLNIDKFGILNLQKAINYLEEYI